MKFITESGAQYIYKNGCLTRLSELPFSRSNPRKMLVNHPATPVVEVEVGSRAIFSFIYDGKDDAIFTSPVTRIEE